MSGVQGVITAKENTPQAIITASQTLLRGLVEANGISFQDVASIILTTTPDLDAASPAKAARQTDWHEVALLCTILRQPTRGVRIDKRSVLCYDYAGPGKDAMSRV